ncbi:MAG: YdiU family protein [bacterium]|nr:YdiU family protein [bacterium]
MTFAQAVPELSLAWRAQPPPNPELAVLNEPLAAELGLDPDHLRTPDGIHWLTGASPESETFAHAYSGHQFGHYSPRLGDGRALLLEERRDTTGTLRDLHLKGSGPTPFSRGGDGKAVLAPMLREFLVGEFLHAASIPSTRALAVLTTGEPVWRDGGPQPGALLVRVATGLIRVGTFQFAATRGPDVLRRLADYAISRHVPSISDDDAPYLGLFRHVCRAQASLIADWMSIGFVHGVMNTDNMVIAGESMDFGPCAFLDAFDTRAVFSSIDHAGRYAYGNQPAIAQWNLARFGETLLPLIAEDPQDAVEPVTELLNEFAADYEREIGHRMAAKLGLPSPNPELTSECLTLLQRHRIDYTLFFRALAAGTAADLFPEDSGFPQWHERWSATIGDPARAATEMNTVNPIYIPRNHIVEDTLAAATTGDLTPLNRLVTALRNPFTDQPGMEDLTQPPPSGCPPHVTFCGT